MDLLTWIIVGLIAGFLARKILPGEGTGGILSDLIVGVLGAVLGGWIISMFGITGVTGINFWSIVIAFVGAALLLWGSRTFTANKTLN